LGRNVNLEEEVPAAAPHQVTRSRIAYLAPVSELRRGGYFSSWERAALALGGGALICLLVLASNLAPDPLGTGTHRQLGLPGCSMLMMAGMRCPGCGMTTAWSHCVRGNWDAAFQANLGGTLLCILSMICSPILLALAIRGRPTPSGWFLTASLTSVAISMAIALIEWLIRLASG